MFETIKLFDLAHAPVELQEEHQFQPLKSVASDLDMALLCVRVGDYALSGEKAVVETVYEVSLAEFLLHQWLLKMGASNGDVVLLHWQVDGVTAAMLQHDFWPII